MNITFPDHNKAAPVLLAAISFVSAVAAGFVLSQKLSVGVDHTSSAKMGVNGVTLGYGPPVIIVRQKTGDMPRLPIAARDARLASVKRDSLSAFDGIFSELSIALRENPTFTPAQALDAVAVENPELLPFLSKAKVSVSLPPTRDAFNSLLARGGPVLMVVPIEEILLPLDLAAKQLAFNGGKFLDFAAGSLGPWDIGAWQHWPTTIWTDPRSLTVGARNVHSR